MISALVSSISGAWIWIRCRALDGGLGREVRHLLERLDVLGPAVGVAAVVEGVDADEDVVCFEHLGPGERDREEDGVARGHVGDRECPRRSRRRSAASGRRSSAVRAEPPKTFRSMSAITCSSTPSRAATSGGRCEFGLVALAVAETEGVGAEALGPWRSRGRWWSRALR